MTDRPVRRTATRRRFIAGTAGAIGAGAVTFTGVSTGRASAATGGGRRVAVLGAGVAGLTAAQELVERGFTVDVYERKELGGKSRSIPVPNSASGGRQNLPGEHGFRYVPGFYSHLPETMARIPVGTGSETVHDHLVPLDGVLYSRIGSREDLEFKSHYSEPPTLEGFQRFVIALLQQFQALPADETLFFARQLAMFATSSNARRFGQWEKMSWQQFIRADKMSAEFRTMLADGMTTHLVASRPDIASARSVGILTELYFYALAGRGSTGYMGRSLDGPSSEAWINPWVAYLRRRGVTFHVGYSVEDLRMNGGRIASAAVREPGGALRQVEADWYVCALPVERARKLWNADVRAAAPQLAKMDGLRTEWMNGIQFYLDRPTPIIRGFVDYLDSPWALVSISQAQTWNRSLPDTYGDGSVQDVLSVNIANFDKPGIVYNKPAKECTPAQIAEEVLAQMRAALEDTGRTVIPESSVKSWFLDPAITYPDGGSTAANDEPLIVSNVGSWDMRPTHNPSIPNLFLCSDYVRDNLSCASMEAANETAKRAVNSLLEAAGSDADGCTVQPAYEMPEFRLLKQADDIRYKLGLPHVLDLPWP